MKPVTTKLAKWAQTEFARRGGTLSVLAVRSPSSNSEQVEIVALRKVRGLFLYEGEEHGSGHSVEVVAIGEFGR